MKKPKWTLEMAVQARQSLARRQSLSRIKEIRKLLDATERCLDQDGGGYPIYLDDLKSYVALLSADAICFNTVANLLHDMKPTSKRPKR